MTYTESVLGAVTMLSLVGLLGLMSCSRVLPATLEEKLASSSATAGDHLAAAMLYQNKERELEAEARKFETALATTNFSADSKGFHRAALRAAAQEKRHEAKEMQKLYAAHLRQGRALHGKVHPQ
ncbi:MAG TPA: hypothetical protein VJU02_08350 [Nitrospiraceae bacterium]|nr:hypothetical protein [Nitrospiraceae bacterium]